MSGGPPHHPHNRQVPATNAAWNHHLQVPSYFPTQPQLAHSSNEHIPYQYQSTWHKPALPTEAMKMFKMEPLFPRDCVDLSRNGNQNGELLAAPISLSVRDTNKINSLPASALDIQAVELTKPTSPKVVNPGLKADSPGLKSMSPGLKSMSPGIKSSSPAPKSASPGVTAGMLPAEPKSQKRSNVRVDSILERLNPNPEKSVFQEKFGNVAEKILERASPALEKIVAAQEKIVSADIKHEQPKSPKVEKPAVEKPTQQIQSVIVQAASSYDESSSSSSISNIPTSTSIRDDDAVSMHSNEDSLDGNKSRRKRKPSKTVRVSKDEEIKTENTVTTVTSQVQESTDVTQAQKEAEPMCISSILEGNKVTERRRSSDDLDAILPAKTRRKTSSESETIDDIAAMVQEGLKEKEQKAKEAQKPPDDVNKEDPPAKPISVSVIKTKDNLSDTAAKVEESPENSVEAPSTTLMTPAQKKASTTSFVEVENKLEEMFAGIEDSGKVAKHAMPETPKNDTLDIVNKLEDDSLVKLDETMPEPMPSTSQDVTSTSTEIKKKNSTAKKPKRKAAILRRTSDALLETAPSPKKKGYSKRKKANLKNNAKKKLANKAAPNKETTVKDVYAYDSGSNASSSKSRGPFIQIRGPRDSPISVSVVNTPTNEEDGERRPHKLKKFHDDSEYRHKVRSKGLHCSTLSNKYDAQTKDATWICAFCKRGPHASSLSGPSADGKAVPAGDLFGPYFITTQCPEFERRLDDPYDKQFKSKKITKALAADILPVKVGKKQKRKHSDADEDNPDVYLGIIDTGNNTFEVWAHEDCMVWSPGVYLVGPKIVGFEEAVWSSCNVGCRSCQLKGANICCLRRGCLATSHLCCARQGGWGFDDDAYKAFCPEHKVP